MKLLAILLAAVLAALLCRPCPAKAETAHRYASALLEAQTGMCIAGTDPDAVLPVGSLAKLMTVYLTAQAVAAGSLTPDTEVAAPREAQAQPGAVIWLTAGEKMTVRALLEGVIIGNANDAAYTLACACDGTEAAFTAHMNRAAAELGMRQTQFADPCGLLPENLSTAAELGLLCRALLAFDWLTPAFTTWRSFLRDGKTELVAENTLTRSYEGILGMKAGHGELSGYTLAAAAARQGKRMIAVVLGCDSPDERFTYAKNLLNKGFSGYYVTTPDFSAEFLLPVRVRHGTEAAVLTETGALRSIAAPSGSKLSCVTVLPEYAEAPVRRGDRLGTAAFYCGDTYVFETPLFAADSVDRRSLLSALKMLLSALFPAV